MGIVKNNLTDLEGNGRCGRKYHKMSPADRMKKEGEKKEKESAQRGKVGKKRFRSSTWGRRRVG